MSAGRHLVSRRKGKSVSLKERADAARRKADELEDLLSSLDGVPELLDQFRWHCESMAKPNTTKCSQGYYLSLARKCKELIRQIGAEPSKTRRVVSD